MREFAERYQRDAPSLVALEEYIQNATSGGRLARQQVTTAELVMVRLQGAAGWIRDVLTVNKRQVGDRQERLLKLLGIRVPIKMTERYSTTIETIDAIAKYSDFRRFAVSTGETLIKPPGR